MLREPDLSLEQAIKICRASEEVKLQSKEIKGETKTSESLVDAANKNAQKNTSEKRPRAMIKNCKYCGKEHFQGRCPAYNRQCGKCGKYNHFASVCMSKPRQNVRQIDKNEQNNGDLEDGNYSTTPGNNQVPPTNTNTSTASERNETYYRSRLRTSTNPPDRYGFRG